MRAKNVSNVDASHHTEVQQELKSCKYKVEKIGSEIKKCNVNLQIGQSTTKWKRESHQGERSILDRDKIAKLNADNMKLKNELDILKKIHRHEKKTLINTHRSAAKSFNNEIASLKTIIKEVKKDLKKSRKDADKLSKHTQSSSALAKELRYKKSLSSKRI